MPVICIANQKGGVGKTTTAAALAQGLSELNKRVLLIAWDPQASLTITMGFIKGDDPASSAGLCFYSYRLSAKPRALGYQCLVSDR